MGKTKKDSESENNANNTTLEVEGSDELTYEQKLENVSIIAKPMAPKKLTKKCYKLIKKGIIFIYHRIHI